MAIRNRSGTLRQIVCRGSLAVVGVRLAGLFRVRMDLKLRRLAQISKLMPKCLLPENQNPESP